MSQPDPYNRFFNFANFQAANPAAPLPASPLDIELSRIKAVIDQIRTSIRFMQRDDFAIANDSIGLDQLKPEVSVGLNPPTIWSTGINYVARDTVITGSIFYQCVTSHVSGVFATDLAAGKWTILADFTAVGTPAASITSYDNSASGLAGSNVQDAIDEIAADVANPVVAITDGTINGTTIGASVPDSGRFTSLNATAGGSLTGTWSDMGVVTTIDINGGTIDGTVIGGSTKAAGGFTTLVATGAFTGTSATLSGALVATAGTFSGVVTGTVLRASAGSAASPGMGWNGTSTGFFPSTANEIAVSLAGTVKGAWSANGFNVGLGTALIDPDGTTLGVSLSTAGALANYFTSGAGFQMGAGFSSGTMINFKRVGTSCGSITFFAGGVAFNTTSDKRKKYDWEAFDSGAILDAIEVWRFKWIVDGSVGYGVLAQDAQPAFPQAIVEGEDGFLQADYSKFVPVLMAEIKDLRRRLAAAGL